MNAVVTGAAGFIGATLARTLLDRGDSVIGIDSFLDSYPRPIKESRLKVLSKYENFRFIEANLVDMNLSEVLQGTDYVFHLAAQAGVRTSWGQRFEVYTESNILVTQKLLEAAKNSSIRRFVYSSSSSIYGDAEIMPTPEDAKTNPISPYAVSKLAGEHLCQLYQHNYGVPSVTLRYFTVYGPYPRPDQAVYIFVRAILEDNAIQIYGDGEQLRGMTYVDDVVRANILACEKECVGEAINIGGGSSITVHSLVASIADILGRRAKIEHVDPVKGDARNTLADITKAGQILSWQPEVDTAIGLEKTIRSMGAVYFD